jgi:hypothetical protein
MSDMPDEVKLCVECGKRPAARGDLCHACYQADYRARKKQAAIDAAKPKVPDDLAVRVQLAKTTEDWQKLAAMIAPVMQAILDGTGKATAAQTSLIKDIMNRAYGKPVASAQEKREAAGVIVLPTLDTGEKMMICPKCGYNATASTVEA